MVFGKQVHKSSIDMKARWRRIALAVLIGVAFFPLMAVVGRIQGHIRPHFNWLLSSHRYKSEVLSNPTAGKSEFKHVEWDGDGWGSGATGDWMSYVVFDPLDSLSGATKKNVPTEYKGIPCKVILVRRLEKQWHSVVLDMNQFWDKMHPHC